MRKGRLSAVARWGCTVAALAVVAAAVFCLFRSAACWDLFGQRRTDWRVELGGGRLTFTAVRDYGVVVPRAGQRWSVGQRLPWSWGMSDKTNQFSTWRGGLLWESRDQPVWMRHGGVTLVYPFLLAATPATLLWYSHLRRHHPGKCRSCRYPRRGLAPDAPCPECGKVPAV